MIRQSFDSATAIGDKVIVLDGDSKLSATVVNGRYKGSFSGKGFHEFDLETDDGRKFKGYSN